MIITALHIIIGVLEIIGALIILVSASLSLFDLASTTLQHRNLDGVESVRLDFAQRLVLALEFLIAADILATLHTPTLASVALLGAIIIVRTVLSLSIAYELRQASAAASKTGQANASGGGDNRHDK